MTDLKYMDLAYKQALKAASNNEVPIGAILVDSQGKVVARGYNQVEKKKTQLAHAEMIVLQKACKKIKDWRLLELTLYVTVQPCLMCLGALYLSRVFHVVYGTVSLKFGMPLQQKITYGIYKNLPMDLECLGYEKAQKIMKKFFEKRRDDNVEQSRIREHKKRFVKEKKRA